MVYFSTMNNNLYDRVPTEAIPQIMRLLEHDQLVVKIKNERRTRHGDYKALPNGRHQITINSNLNEFRFLITLIHEIAHFETYQKFGRAVKPHRKEWKHVFQRLMLPFLCPDIFPDELLPLLAQHFKNPKASSDTDVHLSRALKSYDQPNGLTYVNDVSEGSQFKLYNGRVFQRGKKRVKRIECVEINTGKLYLFNPNAEVELLSI